MRRVLFSPVDIAPLVFFRIVGVSLITIEIVGQLVTDYGDAYVSSSLNFSYLFFEWITPWPAPGIYVHFLFNIAMGVCVAAGFYYRVTTVLFFLGQASMFFMDKAIYINHIYLYCLISFLLIFMPCHADLSFDARRDPSIRRTQVPAWCLYVLRFQLAVVYFYAGVAKLQPDWLAGLPLAQALPRKAHYFLIGPVLAAPWTGLLMSWAGALFDLLIVPGLLWKRTRPLAFAAAVGFHGWNILTFGIGTFPWFSLVMTTLFFEPSSFRKLSPLARRLAPLDGADANHVVGASGLPRTESVIEPAVPAGLVVAGLTLYVLVQVAMPLRPFVYAGTTEWNEAGHNFSWRMMLRAKAGTIVFVVRDPATGEQWLEHPKHHLTYLQYRKMIGKPDLLLQFAHYLADEYAERGHADVEVRVRAKISLNGRRAALLADPKVDLAAERRSLRAYPWVLPLPAG